MARLLFLFFSLSANCDDAVHDIGALAEQYGQAATKVEELKAHLVAEKSSSYRTSNFLLRNGSADRATALMLLIPLSLTVASSAQMYFLASDANIESLRQLILMCASSSFIPVFVNQLIEREYSESSKLLNDELIASFYAQAIKFKSEQEINKAHANFLIYLENVELPDDWKNWATEFAAPYYRAKAQMELYGRQLTNAQIYYQEPAVQ